MSNDDESAALNPEDRARMRRQMSDHAVRLAIASRWEEAVPINREFVRLFPDDPEGFNRLGKALSEVGKIEEARMAYASTLDRDPTNTIAKRNLDRLAALKDTPSVSVGPSQVDTKMFVEESGKSTTATLQAVDSAVAAVLDAGDVVELRVQGNAVNVHTRTGEYVGMVEPRVGLRLARLMTGGNQYAAALASASGDPRVTIRETYQDPSQLDRVSFPSTLASDVRPYIRRSVLRHQLSDDVEFDDDDEVVEEEEEEGIGDGWSDASEDIEAVVEVAGDSDDDDYD
ncbi:MAG TPA: hypothetical protein VFK32_00430 [Tepidiformaceae bacterium]|nr:hypothetical protein [Tepidiformaceae bacterium]